MRVVFDTNILVSALTLPGGRADQAVGRLLEGRDHLLISKPILHELLEVLARKFSRDQEELARVAVWLAELAETVEPALRMDVLDDKPDNRILECAVAGRAELIVTGDGGLLGLGRYAGVRIVSLRAYLEGEGSD